MSGDAVLIFFLLTIMVCTGFGVLIGIAIWVRPEWPWFRLFLLLSWAAGALLFCILALGLIELEITNNWEAFCPAALWCFGGGVLLVRYKDTLNNEHKRKG